jgi:hypothetical protein
VKLEAIACARKMLVIPRGEVIPWGPGVKGVKLRMALWGLTHVVKNWPPIRLQEPRDVEARDHRGPHSVGQDWSRHRPRRGDHQRDPEENPDEDRLQGAQWHT